jgi:hypothetical protein
MRLRDGTEVEVTEAMLRAAPEAALRAMAVALSLLAALLRRGRTLGERRGWGVL